MAGKQQSTQEERGKEQEFVEATWGQGDTPGFLEHALFVADPTLILAPLGHPWRPPSTANVSWLVLSTAALYNITDIALALATSPVG